MFISYPLPLIVGYQQNVNFPGPSEDSLVLLAGILWLEGNRSPDSVWLEQKKKASYLTCCCCAVAQSCPTLCDPMEAARQTSVPHHLLKFAQVHFLVLAIPSCHLIIWYPLLLPSIFPSIRDFSSESAIHVRSPVHLDSKAYMILSDVQNDLFHHHPDASFVIAKDGNNPNVNLWGIC